LERGFVFDAIGKMLLVGVGCGLVRLRGETLAEIGLKRPTSWLRTFMIGIGLAAIVFIAMYLSERAGFRRDLSKFKDVQGNLELAVLGVLYALIGAGFYEEFTFRGFLMQGLAMFFGGSRGAWIATCVLQGALFGLAHAYQNSLGIAITGALGVLTGLLVLALGRKSLAGDHRPRTLRRESFRFVLFRGPAGGLSPYQRFNRRGSKRYSIGSPILILLKSVCLGFSKKFISLVLSALGTARATDFPWRTHSSPICIVSKIGGSAFQCGGRFLTRKYSVSLSSQSSRKDTYRSMGDSGIVWTNNSSAARDSCSLT
jgi:membrane protease YdiL (CAAX protease family)